jgi:YVTN family beta-propeller protein
MAVGTTIGESEPAQFRILGPLEVVRSGCVVPLGGRRQRAVLALLLLEANRVVSVDRLAEDVWGGHPPQGSVTTLQSYVFRLRRALEPDRLRGGAGEVLVTKDRGYLLRVNREHLDAAIFEEAGTAGRAALDAGRYTEAAQRLRQALDLWRGPVLADLADYAFTRPEAARLEELRLAAVEDRIDADLALGRHQALTGELERLAGEYPLRERLHGQLMLALYRCGRQAEALAAYRRVRDLLAGELGIDPGEPLQCLHGSVLAHDPALDWHGARPAPTQGHPAAGPAAGRAEPERARRHARRLLAVGAALVVAAAAGIIVAVTRPWAAQPSTSLPGNSVGLIDAAGGRAGAPVSVGNPAGLAYGDGAVWAVDSTGGTVSRINPATHAVVDQIPVGTDPNAVTVTGGNVWVANSGSGTVSQINIAADRVVQTIPVGNVPVAIASGPSGVWVANQGDDTVDRIDPVTGHVIRTVQVGGRPDGIAVGRNAVWVANSQDGTVTRIDPGTGQPTDSVLVGAGPAGIAITPAAVWVANLLNLTVSKIDPATDRVTATIPVGDGPGAIAAAKDGIWVGDEFGAALDRINPRAGQVDRVIPLGSSPQGMAVTASGLWVAARPFAAASHRGGTLTEVGESLPALDPAQAYDPIAISVLGTVYDGLVALRKSGGAQGFTLVPDLAVTLPRPADGGRTYTFTLRRGIRYSSGAPVQASDFRRGIWRELNPFGSYSPYYEGILGGQACNRHPKRCDLAAGIVTNDAAGTVTFHLAQADPDFLYKLSVLLATPAPPGAPGHAITGPPFLPGTGPYKIAHYRPNASVTLVRNPYFRQWSYAAQPAGYPDVIRFQQIADPGKLQSAVAAGRADIVDISMNGLPYRPLAVRYPARIHAGVLTFTTSFFLNTRQPPFTSVKARQAVNYAIDRGRVIQILHHGPGQAAPACQIWPPDFPGYQRYCPYTFGPKDGVWHGPDLAKAARLAAQSGTTHVPVTVWSWAGGRSQAAYVVQVLRRLGYRATLRDVSETRFFNLLAADPGKVQIGFWPFGADFPTASDFFFPNLSCSIPNPSQYCNPRAEELASQAQAAQLTDPAAARTLWARVDRIVTNQAPWVPVLNWSPTAFVSARAGNYQAGFYGPLLDQIWVRLCAFDDSYFRCLPVGSPLRSCAVLVEVNAPVTVFVTIARV